MRCVKNIHICISLVSRPENHAINSSHILRVPWHPRDAFIDDTLISTSC